MRLDTISVFKVRSTKGSSGNTFSRALLKLIQIIVVLYEDYIPAVNALMDNSPSTALRHWFT